MRHKLIMDVFYIVDRRILTQPGPDKAYRLIAIRARSECVTKNGHVHFHGVERWEQTSSLMKFTFAQLHHTHVR